jgi:hypothetical protein
MIILAFLYGWVPNLPWKTYKHVEIIGPVACLGMRCPWCERMSEVAKAARPIAMKFHLLTYQVSIHHLLTELVDKHWVNTAKKNYSYVLLHDISTEAALLFLDQQKDKPFNRSLYPHNLPGLNLLFGRKITKLKGVTNRTLPADCYNQPSWLCSELASTLLQINNRSDIIQYKHPCCITPNHLRELVSAYALSKPNAGEVYDKGVDLLDQLKGVCGVNWATKSLSVVHKPLVSDTSQFKIDSEHEEDYDKLYFDDDDE